MTTKRTGYVEKWKDAAGNVHRRARIHLGDGTRHRVALPDGLSEDRAREAAAALQEREDAEGQILAAKEARARLSAPVVDLSSCDAWFRAWNEARRVRGLTSTKDNEQHWRLHIRDVLGGRHVRDWTGDDLRRLVAVLDEKIVASDLSAKSAGNIWGTATKMVADACRSKLPELRCRVDDPSTSIEGPDRGERREKQFLFPSEFLKLMACTDVPLRWRRAIALAVYLFPRAGELRSLRWDAVDLEHGTVHIHRAFERRTRTEKGTKTRTGRRFAIEPTVLPLLRAMHAEAGGKGQVCPIPNRMADRLRGWLERAGVKRHELHDDTSPTTKPIGFHDLRATGLTWMAVRGDEPLKIMSRAGHASFATSQLYIRTAEAVRDGFGAVFPELPAELLGKAGDDGNELSELPPDDGERAAPGEPEPTESAHDTENRGSIGLSGAGHGIRIFARREIAGDLACRRGSVGRRRTRNSASSRYLDPRRPRLWTGRGQPARTAHQDGSGCERGWRVGRRQGGARRARGAPARRRRAQRRGAARTPPGEPVGCALWALGRRRRRSGAPAPKNVGSFGSPANRRETMSAMPPLGCVPPG